MDALDRLKRDWKACTLLLLSSLVLFPGVVGCTRSFYRKCADREVADILKEKDQFPAWRLEQFHVYPDPRARFADPTNPDRPPMPPDDPAAWDLSPHPQQPGHAGVRKIEGTGYLEMLKAWDGANRAERQARWEEQKKQPGYQEKREEQGFGVGRQNRLLQTYVEEPFLGKKSGYLITWPQAVELGLVSNTTYQRIREDLYLAALPVTQERFSFAYQWAAVENAIRQWAGPQSSVGRQNYWSLGTAVGFRKLFSTGALLTAAFANNTVFNFNSASPPGFTSMSKVSLDLVQPLLQGGGKAVTLEPLTRAERNLLYEMRAFARFREQFYVAVSIGSSVPSDLASASGASTSGSPISALAALGIASTDVSGGFVGYLSTLYRELDMAADKRYVTDLESALKLFEGLQEGGQVAPIQVAQVTSTLLSARNTVLSDQQFVANALDQFKLILGLPANLPLLLDDGPGRPITLQLDRYYQVLTDADAAYRKLERQEQLPPDQLRAFLLRIYTTAPLVQDTEFQRKLPAVWKTWTKATDEELQTRLRKLAQTRRKLLDTKTDREMQGKTLSPGEAQSLRDAEFEGDVGALEQMLRRYESRPWEKQTTESQRNLDRAKLFRVLAYSAEIVGVWARNERFERVATLWPALPRAPLDNQIDLLAADLDLAQEAAVQAALESRLDLMNARAQVTDAWRQLRVTANALLGVLNVSYHLDSQTPPLGTNPLAFSTPRTNQEIIFNGALPLVRVAERNAYRTALINYQRARRNLMNLEDNVAAQVRFDVRQLHLFAENYKIQKEVLASLYSQVENALEVIAAPVDPDQLKSTGTAGQANAAALTNQYLTALGQLNGQQTKMYDVWLSFLATRIQLYLDLERLPLDNRGVWIDEPGTTLSASAAGSAILGQPCAVDETRRTPVQRGEVELLPRPRLLPPPSAQPPPE
jgi:hypothetical protein